MKIADIHESQFTSTKWDRADAKMKFAKRLCRFLERRCPVKSWNKAFYHRLSMMFGFIAHFNVHGFWDARLSSPQKRLATLQAIQRHLCYGKPDHTWSDVERVVQAFVAANDLMPEYERLAQEAAEKADRAELDRLRQKYN